MTRLGAIGIGVLTSLGIGLVGCGDGENQNSGQPSGRGGSSASTTGAGAPSLGGSSTSSGQSQTGGQTATGGQSQTGGQSSTGGQSQTDSTIIAGAGGAGASCQVAFVLPASGKTLTAADDASGQLCAEGVVYDVAVVTDAPSGTPANITIDGVGQPNAVTVANASARFERVKLGTTGTHSVTVQVGTDGASDSCKATQTVTIDCASTCVITKPVLTGSHVALNGVPVAAGGDRVSSVGSPYQAEFTVATAIEDGQPVALSIVNGSSTTSQVSLASEGKAIFSGVTLSPDGTYTATANCTARSGAEASSSPVTLPVDTLNPDLAVTRWTAANSGSYVALAEGDHFAKEDDADGDASNGLQLKICGATTQVDALDLEPAVFGALANNFCVVDGNQDGTSGSSPICAPASASTSNGACINFTCPGAGKFNLITTLKDRAQNPTASVFKQITCAASTPIVQFRNPISGGDPADPASFTDQSLRILAASTGGAEQKKDKDPNTAGAQFDVVVCTSAPPDSDATLSQGWYNAASTEVATVKVAADTQGLCQGSQPNVAVFGDVKLNESTVSATQALLGATSLTARVVDYNLAVGTATIHVWVDSVVPNLTLVSPANFCGSFQASDAAWTPSTATPLTFTTPVLPVIASVTSDDGVTDTLASVGSLNAFSQISMTTGPSFPPGVNTFSATVAKPSGNVGRFPTSGTCSVTVGPNPPPTVTWRATSSGASPVGMSLLTAPGNTDPRAVVDADPATPGWQGTLRACASLTGDSASGVTMQFSVNGVNVGVGQNLNQADGCATLAISGANQVPEGSSVQLRATTVGAASGVGVGTIRVPVDVNTPSDPIGLSATVKNRRQTSFTLKWRLPGDGSPATRYLVKVAKTIIDDATKFAAAETVPFNGTPQPLGTDDTVDVMDRYLENEYYFAVQALDSVGNASAITHTTTPSIEHFIQTEILPPTGITGTNFGWSIDGTSDVNGDGLPDLVVGSSAGLNVYIYFGSASGFPAAPSVTIQGTEKQFGRSLAVVGDVNGDTFSDLAIGSPTGAGKLSVFFGRQSWPSVLAESAANLTVVTNADESAGGDVLYGTAPQLGYSVARLGDFNGDSLDDIAVSALYYYYETGSVPVGQVVVIYGKQRSAASQTSLSLPEAFSSGDALRIDGDASNRGGFGMSLLGTGHFYGSSDGTSLVVSAPSTTTAAGARAGRLYSFGGVTGTPASVPLTAARHVGDGQIAAGVLGFYGVRSLGDFGPAGQAAIATTYRAGARLELRTGLSSSGPFAQLFTVTTAESPASNAFAMMIAASGVPGTGAAMSVIGNGRSDLVVSTRVGGVPRLFIVDGSQMNYTAASLQIESVAQVVVPLLLPANRAWLDFASSPTLIRDADGDAVADIVVGEVAWSGTADGRVVVLR